MPHSDITPLCLDSSEEPETAAEEILTIFKAKHETHAAAESLTGGSLMSYITSVEGSSNVFRGGIVTYATPLKHKLLGVDAELILDHGVIEWGSGTSDGIGDKVSHIGK
jgi:nicotinamide mononucleotide (NMN) deamidase PncC